MGLPSHYDIVIAGAGIIGLSIARAFVQKGLTQILILEKERALGTHTSGRNSGILHAGIYYASDSLKAKFCALGAQALKDFARDHQIKILETGKVILPVSDDQIVACETLYQRAKANGAHVEWIDAQQLRSIEPLAAPSPRALYSPQTAAIDSQAVLEKLRAWLESRGVRFDMGRGVVAIGPSAKRLTLSDRTEIFYGHFVNAAGLQADKLAHQMDLAKNYRILPFKGLYREWIGPLAEQIRGSIYPVPDARFPFLGVHITRTARDKVVLGPTALPAFGRENYRGLTGLEAKTSVQIVRSLAQMTLKNTDGIRSLMRAEIPKFFRHGLWREVQRLSPHLNRSDISPQTTKVGLRAQLLRVDTGRLEMDFKIESGPSSTHVLNAISPGFTCSFPFGEYVVEQTGIC